MSRNILIFASGEGDYVPGIWWIQASNAVKHPIKHRIVLKSKDLGDQNVNITDTEKPLYRHGYSTF